MTTEDALLLSRYQVLSEVNAAHGVYLTQGRESKKIYIKKVLSIFSEDVYRYLKEHPVKGTPFIHELVRDGDRLIVIEDYVAGETLEEKLSSGFSFSNEDILRIGTALCDIVSRLHAAQPPIIHRDIKPSNVIITSDGDVVLLDLNAAKNLVEGQETDTRMIGTEGFAAPEQYGFGASTPRTDIYAIGMLINVLVTGRISRVTDATSPFAPVVEKCLALSPENRYASAQELKDALAGALIPSAASSPSADVSAFGRRFHAYRDNPGSKAAGASAENDSAISRLKRFARFLPPGFRTGSLTHMLSAILYYAAVIGIARSASYEEMTKPGQATSYRVVIAIMLLVPVITICNYLNIQRFMPLCRSKNFFLRLLGDVILTVALIAIVFVIFAIYVTFVFG